MSRGVLLPNGDVVVQTTRCRFCLSDRIYKDFQGEWQCFDCNPPQLNYKKKVQEQVLRHAVRKAQEEKIQELDDEVFHD